MEDKLYIFPKTIKLLAYYPSDPIKWSLLTPKDQSWFAQPPSDSINKDWYIDSSWLISSSSTPLRMLTYYLEDVIILQQKLKFINPPPQRRS